MRGRAGSCCLFLLTVAFGGAMQRKDSASGGPPADIQHGTFMARLPYTSAVPQVAAVQNAALPPIYPAGGATTALDTPPGRHTPVAVAPPPAVDTRERPNKPGKPEAVAPQDPDPEPEPDVEAAAGTSVITPLAKSLKAHRPSLLVIPPTAAGRNHLPIGRRTVAIAKGVSAPLDVAAEPVLTPNTKERFGRKRQPPSLASMAPSKPLLPSSHTENALYSAGVAGSVLLIASIIGGTHHQIGVLLGAVSLVSAFLGLHGLSLLKAEQEASMQQKEGRRGRTELLIAGCLFLLLCMGQSSLAFAGLDESGYSKSLQCEREAWGVLQNIHADCSSEKAVDVVRAVALVFGSIASAVIAVLAIESENGAQRASLQLVELKTVLAGQLSESQLTTSHRQHTARSVAMLEVKKRLEAKHGNCQRRIFLSVLLHSALPALLFTNSLVDATKTGYIVLAVWSATVGVYSAIVAALNVAVLMRPGFVLQVVSAGAIVVCTAVLNMFDSAEGRVCKQWKLANPQGVVPDHCGPVDSIEHVETAIIVCLSGLAMVTAGYNLLRQEAASSERALLKQKISK